MCDYICTLQPLTNVAQCIYAKIWSITLNFTHTKSMLQMKTNRSSAKGIHSVKLVLNMTSQCFHKASWGFRILQWRVVMRPKTVLQHSNASQFLVCKEMFRNTLQCFWLCLLGWFGLLRDADVMSLSKWPTDHGTLWSTPFLSCLAASIIQCQVSM